jgi:hypothetical protein
VGLVDHLSDGLVGRQMLGWHLWSRPAARLLARLAAAAAPELNVLGKLCQHAHVDTVAMLRQDISAPRGDLGDPALRTFQQQRLGHVGDRPGDPVGIPGRSAARQRYLPVLLGDAQDLRHVVADIGRGVRETVGMQLKHGAHHGLEVRDRHQRPRGRPSAI